jgi:hypothetical protein
MRQALARNAVWLVLLVVAFGILYAVLCPMLRQRGMTLACVVLYVAVGMAFAYAWAGSLRPKRRR